MASKDVSRRRFLVAAATVSAGATAACTEAGTIAALGRGAVTALWSDPATWGGRLPAADESVVIGRPVVVDGDVRVAGVVVKEGGKLIFSRGRDATVRVSENVIVRGLLEMRPRSTKVKHCLVFEKVNEGAFKGEGLDPLATDVGLWVMGSGRLDIRGASKRAWTRADGAINAGARSIELRQKPSGWRRGDKIAVAPTSAPSNGNHYEQFDVADLKAINGHRITLSAPAKFAHPTVIGVGVTHTAEVLNLTRNVEIRGTPGGRSHIFIRSDKRQTIKNCMLLHMGPRKNGEKIEGRWPLHFHHAHDGSRGSVVKGVVVRGAGSHAFVPHKSHGVKFQNCIAFDVFESAFWWDEEISDATHDILWDRCVAAKVKIAEAGDRFRLSGFILRTGERNEVRDCVAVGVQGLDGSAGFHWLAPQEGVWKFKNCLAHNNATYGAFAWMNNDVPHQIDGFTTYRNGTGAVLHGAYKNAFRYGDMELLEDTFELHARSREGTDGVPLTLSQTKVVKADVGLLVSGSVVPGLAPAVIEGWDFEDCAVPIEFEHRGENAGDYEFNGCTVDGRALEESDIKFTFVSSGSTVKIDGQQVYS